jgi:hypothetical protein
VSSAWWQRDSSAAVSFVPISPLMDLSNSYLRSSFLIADRLDLKNNTLTGSIPSELGQLSTALGEFDFWNDAMELPYLLDLSNAVSWSFSIQVHLVLHDNALTGTIPTELLQLNGLGEFSLCMSAVAGDSPRLTYSSVFLRLGQQFGSYSTIIALQAVSPVSARSRIVGSLVTPRRIHPVASCNGHSYEHDRCKHIRVLQYINIRYVCLANEFLRKNKRLDWKEGSNSGSMHDGLYIEDDDLLDIISSRLLSSDILRGLSHLESGNLANESVS